MNEDMLAAYLHEIAGDLARMLELTPEAEEGGYRTVIQNVRTALNVDDVAEAENPTIILRTAELEFWRYAENRTASWYTLAGADGERRDRRQVHENIVKLREAAELRLYDVQGQSRVRVSHMPTNDPYLPRRGADPIRVWWEN